MACMLCASEKSMPSRLMNLIQVEVFSLLIKRVFSKVQILHRDETESIDYKGDTGK